MSTKIHATCDALGNPTGFHLTPGQACDLDGADVLLADIPTDTVLADKGYDADERVIERLEAQGKTAVILPKRNRKTPREYDRTYARPVIGLRISLPNPSNIEPWPPAMTNWSRPFSALFTWLHGASG